MKKINLHNYEAFLLDYIEGTLDQELENSLMEFLVLHPEIELEQFDLDAVTLQSPSIKLKDKEALKKSLDSNGLSEIDLLIIGEIEGVNDATKSNLLETERLVNPELIEEVLNYKKTILTAPIITFTGKSSLKRRTSIPLRPIFGIAASLLLLCVFYFISKSNEEIRIDPIVDINTSEKILKANETRANLVDSVTTKVNEPINFSNKKIGQRIVQKIPQKESIIHKMDSALAPNRERHSTFPEYKEPKVILVNKDETKSEKTIFQEKPIEEDVWISTSSLAYVPSTLSKKDKDNTIDLKKFPKEIKRIVNTNLLNEKLKSDQLLVHSFTRGKLSISKTSTL